MCFSAPASFIAGTALSAIGLVALRNTRKRTEVPFAMIPLLFGIQQLIEGVIITFDSTASQRRTGQPVWVLYNEADPTENAIYPPLS